jgi:hypothetical protein
MSTHQLEGTKKRCAATWSASGRTPKPLPGSLATDACGGRGRTSRRPRRQDRPTRGSPEWRNRSSCDSGWALPRAPKSRPPRRSTASVPCRGPIGRDSQKGRREDGRPPPVPSWHRPRDQVRSRARGPLPVDEPDRWTATSVLLSPQGAAHAKGTASGQKVLSASSSTSRLPVPRVRRRAPSRRRHSWFSHGKSEHHGHVSPSVFGSTRGR